MRPPEELLTGGWVLIVPHWSMPSPSDACEQGMLIVKVLFAYTCSPPCSDKVPESNEDSFIIHCCTSSKIDAHPDEAQLGAQREGQASR